MLRSASLRWKILAILVLPTVIIAGLSWILVQRARGDAAKAAYLEQLVQRAPVSDAYLVAVGGELTATLQAGAKLSPAGVTALAAARGRTDRAIASFESSLHQLPSARGATAEDRASLASLDRQLAALPALRTRINSRGVTADDVINGYTRLLQAPAGALGGLTSRTTDTQLGSLLASYVSRVDVQVYGRQERDLIALAYSSRIALPGAPAKAGALAVIGDQSMTELLAELPASSRADLTKRLARIDSAPLTKARGVFSALDAGRRVTEPAGWRQAADARINAATAIAEPLVVVAQQRAAEITAGKDRDAQVLGLLAVIAVLLAVAQGLILSRRITAPLRRLTSSAQTISAELPALVEHANAGGQGATDAFQPVPVTDHDEIGRVAESFNQVTDTTVRVVLEQAALRASVAKMFVNVARRNQALLGRQLHVLERLEEREDREDVLEDLFNVDHLTTRMQRNAESLLVLAGIDSTRRSRQPLRLSDVVRTAISEIEQYSRVDLQPGVDPEVEGRHVMVAAHLVAELLENATRFSDPDTRVDVHLLGTPVGVNVVVVDHGLGMPPADLDEANRTIAEPPSADLAVSDRLGFFVVGRLARKLGAAVRMHPGEQTGVVAVVSLPLSIFRIPEIPVAPAMEAPTELSLPPVPQQGWGGPSEPVHEEPAYEQPTYEQPTYEHPTHAAVSAADATSAPDEWQPPTHEAAPFEQASPAPVQQPQQPAEELQQPEPEQPAVASAEAVTEPAPQPYAPQLQTAEPQTPEPQTPEPEQAAASVVPAQPAAPAEPHPYERASASSAAMAQLHAYHADVAPSVTRPRPAPPVQQGGLGARSIARVTGRAPGRASVDRPRTDDVPILAPMSGELPPPVIPLVAPPAPAPGEQAGGYEPVFTPAPAAVVPGELTRRAPRVPGIEPPADPLTAAFADVIDEHAAMRDPKSVQGNLASFRSAVQRARADASVVRPADEHRI